MGPRTWKACAATTRTSLWRCACTAAPGPRSSRPPGRAGVEIIPMGEFADALGDIPPYWRAALATFPTLHKLLSLRGLLAAESLTGSST